MAERMQIVIEVDAASGVATIKDVEDGLKKVGDEAESSQKSVAGMIKEVAGATVVLGGTVAAIMTSVKAATDFQNALNGMASVARYAGQDVQQTLGKALKLTEDGLLSTTESATALKNLLAKGFTTDQAVEMIGRFKDAAAFGRQGSLDLGEAVVGATEGIKNQNSALVDNSGVTKNISVMQKEYADSLGRTVASLTEAENREAIYQGIMRETEGQVGNAALAADGLTGSNARLSKATNDAAIAFGQSMTPAVRELTDLMTSSITGVNENVLKPFLFLFENIGITAGETVMKASLAFELMTSPSLWFDDKEKAKFQARFDEFGAIAEQSRIDLANRLNSPESQVKQGRDTGARRTEAPEGESKADKTAREKAEKAAEKEQEAIDKAIAQQSAKYEKLQEMAIQAGASDEENATYKLAFDLEQMQREHDLLVEKNDGKATLEQEYEDARVARTAIAQAEIDKIQAKAAADKEKADQAKLRSELSVVNMAKLLRQGDYVDALTTAEKMSAGLATKSRAMFEINKAASMAKATIAGYEAIQSAYAHGTSWGGVAGGVVEAALAAAYTATQIDAISSTSFGGGGAGGAGVGGGVPSLATTVGQPVNNQTQQQPPTTVNIYNQGNVLSSDYVESTIIPQIQSAVNGRDVLLIDPRSRQAAVLGA